MIIEVSSSLPEFKSFEFRSGLNIIVAERHATSSVRDTRNGTGKTSLIEMIHFLLADRKQSASDFHRPELSGETFTASFGESSDNNFQISKKVVDGTEVLTVDAIEAERSDLRSRLSNDWFQLEAQVLDEKYGPTFGALLAYFVRKERNGGFANAVQNSAQQKPWDTQVNLAYLLGLDWRLPQSLQLKKDEKKDADELFKMLKKGLLDQFGLDPQRMQARFDILETEIERKREEVRTAEVVDDYRGRETTANSLSVQIRNLNEQNLADLNLIEDIEAAIEETSEAEEDRSLERLYKEVGVLFSDQVAHRFEQVQSFHSAVARNRRAHLDSEKADANRRLQERKLQINSLQSRLKEHLNVLGSGVAIERYAAIQSELNDLEREAADLRVQIPRIRDVTARRNQLKTEVDRIVDLIGLDVIERTDARVSATRLFAEISLALYDEPGELSLSRSKGVGGLVVETNIRGKKSGGKSHMQVFCFDLMLAIIAKKNSKFPGFLIHDSHIFDGVDGRQIGLALEVARRKCEEHGIQYIVAMNSDDLEKIRAEEDASGEKIFDAEPYINPTRLADDETGGLFGIRF